MKIRISAVVLSVSMAVVALAAHADVYKWKDADGRVHYGDQAKNGAEKIIGGPTNTEAAPADDKDADAKQQKHAEECSRKRDQLTTYQKASRIVEKDSLGNEKEFNADDRKKLIDLTQKQITDGCSDGAAPNQR